MTALTLIRATTEPVNRLSELDDAIEELCVRHEAYREVFGPMEKDSTLVICLYNIARTDGDLYHDVNLVFHPDLSAYLVAGPWKSRLDYPRDIPGIIKRLTEFGTDLMTIGRRRNEIADLAESSDLKHLAAGYLRLTWESN